MNTTPSALLRRAKRYWKVDAVLPVDLFIEMTNAGIDVETEENKFMETVNG